MKVTNFRPGDLPLTLAGWSTGVTSVNSNFNTEDGGFSATNFVQGITAEGSNMLLRPIANFAAGSNIWLTLDAGPGNSIPSNTIRIHSTATGGGGNIISSNGSNNLAAVVNLKAGNNIALGVSGQDITISASGIGGSSNPVPLQIPTATGAIPTTEGYVGWDSDDDFAKVYDGQRELGWSQRGWTTIIYPLLHNATAAYTTALALAANGGTIVLPMQVNAHMLLEDVSVYNTDAATQRTWNWALYINRLNNGNSGENTLDRVAVGTAAETFTPGAASRRFITAASNPVYLQPGVYWMAIQNQHASNTFGLGSTVQGTSGVFGTTARTKTTTNPNGATLDFVAATWTSVNAIYAVVGRGRVFGMSTVF